MTKKIVEDFDFFEGIEKLLEIWFCDDGTSSDTCDLRNIPREQLDEILATVSADIVSVNKNDYLDSYVLSESSMFISKHRFVIKTCGITTLLHAVQDIINSAKEYANMTLENFFYSHRVYKRPEEQITIHKTFDDEVNFLSDIIPNGKAYILGHDPKEQWYLFTTDNSADVCHRDDVNMQIMMEDLDQEAMCQFTKDVNDTSEDVIQNSGIVHLLRGSSNDGFLFDPIGYSLNGLLGDCYYTIHVTPQPNCSYVSFETNVRQHEYQQLVERVLAVFKPGHFIVTLAANKGAICGEASQQVDCFSLNGYCCDDKQDERLKNYSLAYRHFTKKTDRA